MTHAGGRSAKRHSDRRAEYLCPTCTHYPEGLGIVLGHTAWAHEHCGIYPGSSSHQSTYVHTNMDSVAT